MITADGVWEVCDIPSCDAKIKNHRWARIRATEWYFARNGRAFCPIHRPYFKRLPEITGMLTT